MIELRNKRKKELEKNRQQLVEDKKKTRGRNSHNPFAILFPDEPDYVKPAPILSYDISYGSPAVTTQIIAKSPEEALATISRVTQIPSGYINIYHASSEHPDTFVPARSLSVLQTNLIVSTTNIFSPLLFLSEESGGNLRPYNRYRTINNSVLWNADDYKFMNLVVQIERLILTGRLSFFRDFIRRCSFRAAEEDNQIILRNIHVVQTSILHSTTLSCEELHAFLVWSPVVMNLQQVVKYAISSEISSGFSKEQMRPLDDALSPEISLPRIISQPEREIVVYHDTVPVKPRPTLLRECKNSKITSLPVKKSVRNNHRSCSSFHSEESLPSRISTFPSLAPPPLRSQPEALEHFLDKTKDLKLQYDIVSRLDVEDCDTNLCERIITDSDNLLNDEENLLNLSVSHRKYLREKLRKAITQVRTILQEAVAYDSSQLPNSVDQTKTRTILHYFNRCQLNLPNSSRIG